MQQDMQRLLEHKLFIALAIGYTLFLTLGSLINTGELPDAPNNFDKVVHIVAYFGLAMMWYVWVLFKKPEKKTTKRLKNLFVISVLAIVYGIFIEILQGVLTTYRTSDGWDIVANSTGVLVAWCLTLLLIKKTTLLKTKF